MIKKIFASEKWKNTFPGAHIGLLLVGGLDNAGPSALLDKRKRALEEEIRHKYAGFSRTDLLRTQILNAYRNYYKRFNKTYHVLLQLETILHKSKSLPNVSPLVDANFAAEIETLLLSAGHDADRLEMPVIVDASTGTEVLQQMSGASKRLKPGDMIMRDADGVVCSVIYGQDSRTPITSKTKRALYVVYAPVGVPASTVAQHLETIRNNISLDTPRMAVELLEVLRADPSASDQ
jgi:DNA/RNA-binding domain of Phe-tRNA-synthetase-like protein